MLILTRRVGETVMIGNDVTVTVLGVKGNQVRIGINAPKNVAVHREEIYERISASSREWVSRTVTAATSRDPGRISLRSDQESRALRRRCAILVGSVCQGMTRLCLSRRP